MDPCKWILVKDKYIFIIFCNTVTLIPKFGGLTAAMPHGKWWHMSHDVAARGQSSRFFHLRNKTHILIPLHEELKKERVGFTSFDSL